MRVVSRAVERFKTLGNRKYLENAKRHRIIA